MTHAVLDKSLRKAVETGTPVEVVDEETKVVYYLISSEQFQRMASVLSDDVDPRHFYPGIDRIMAEDDVNDPLLESYQ